ncbi:hypothetical protein J437_LFUL003598 [Ladona fulva]|uniref:Uncharacterized protein n=1 Tax=Ladona fulva TaxID=123851 RepID=A0A8K0KIS7_LADFU|nr:hypothetical protein J437_LFUL003598 [Ladona fulva]
MENSSFCNFENSPMLLSADFLLAVGPPPGRPHASEMSNEHVHHGENSGSNENVGTGSLFTSHVPATTTVTLASNHLPGIDKLEGESNWANWKYLMELYLGLDDLYDSVLQEPPEQYVSFSYISKISFYNIAPEASSHQYGPGHVSIYMWKPLRVTRLRRSKVKNLEALKEGLKKVKFNYRETDLDIRYDTGILSILNVVDEKRKLIPTNGKQWFNGKILVTIKDRHKALKEYKISRNNVVQTMRKNGFLESKKMICAVFLDLRRAFETVDRDGLI